jgi:uncharacterized protein (DUF433 family)
MTLAIEDIKLPLRGDEQGTIYIGNTRITLDTVVAHFERGALPEDIASAFPTLRLDDIYLTLGYYLRNKATVDAYLIERRDSSDETRRRIDAQFPPRVSREQLLERRR